MGITIDVQDPKAFAEWCKFIGAIPKADYENRLKADLVAILTEIQLEIEEIEVAKENTEIRAGECCMKGACIDLIQGKINSLKEDT